jgi:tRNA threonylcarbamoyladenosine biosynthesis protein TsaE
MSSDLTKGNARQAWPPAHSGKAEWIRVTHSPEETKELGRELAKQLTPPCVVLLEGELGAGKTTLTKGIVQGLGAAREEDVTSPSFALVHEYCGPVKVYHIDLYRIENLTELSTLGLDDILASDAAVLVEWGEKLGGGFAGKTLCVRLEYAGNDDRKISVAIVPERH